MRAPMELTVRRLVADHLGVGVGELGSEVSLRDDPAADSLDLVELATSDVDMAGARAGRTPRATDVATSWQCGRAPGRSVARPRTIGPA